MSLFCSPFERHHPSATNRPGFTLTEILLSMGIIGVLSTIVIAAIGPREALLKARDAQRDHNVKQLTSAFDQFTIAGTGGILYEGILRDKTGTGDLAMPICIEGMTRDRSCINIDTLVAAGILNGVPRDTAEPCPTLSGYAAYMVEDRVQIVADHKGKLRGDFTIPRCNNDTVAPAIEDINLTLFAATATITWTTDEPAETQVRYGIGSIEENVTSWLHTDACEASGGSEVRFACTIVLQGLESDTPYRYVLRARDIPNPAENVYTTGELHFTTGDTKWPELKSGPDAQRDVRAVTISWLTDEDADSVVAYSEDGIVFLEEVDANLDKDHEVTITGLRPLTEYTYRIRSRDASNNVMERGDFTFETLADVTAPFFVGPITRTVAGNTVTFTWETDEPSTGAVMYDGITVPSVPSTIPFGTGHTVTITGLATEQQYHFTITAWDDVSNDRNAPIESVLIPDTVAPSIVGEVDVQKTYNSAVLTWETDERAIGKLEYQRGTDPWIPATDTLPGQSHSVSLSGLSYETTYTYRITSRDIAGNEHTTVNFAFTTDQIITNIVPSNLGDTSVRLSWNSAFIGQGYVSSSLCPVAGCPTNMGSISNWVSTGVGANGTSHMREVLDLLPGRTYILRPVHRWGSPYTYAVNYITITTLADDTPPEISGVSLLDNRRNIPTPTLRWNTNELTSAIVEFGPTNNYGQTSGPIDLSPMKTSGHSYTFPALPMNARTYFRITAMDAAGIESEYASNFITDDIIPSLVTPWEVTNLTGNSATITWAVDEIANPIAYCGTVSTSLSNCSGGWAYNWTQPWTWSTSQTRTISGLLPGTTYYVRLYSRDASTGSAGSPVNQWSSDLFTFTTPGDTTPPEISGVSVSGRNTTTPTISWNTNEPADSRIEWGFYPDFTEDSGVYDTSPMKTSGHSRTLSPALLPMNSRIYIRIWGTDAAGNTSLPFVTSFWTDNIPPALTAGPTVSISNATSATVNWTVNEPAEAIIAYSRNSDLSSPLWVGIPNLLTNQSTPLTGLTPEATYYYRIYSRDSAGNLWFSPTIYSFLIDKTPPTLTNLTVSRTDTTATISWVAHEPAGARVEYGTTTAYGTAAMNTVLSTTPSVTLTGLTPNTLYHYRIRSWDAAGNWTSYSTNQIFTTTDVDPPVISNVQVTDIADTTAIVRWTTNEPATSRVAYGVTDYGTLSTLSSTLVTSHSRVLQNLQKGTTYQIRALSSDGMNAASLDGPSFTTTNTTAPTISGIQISSATENSLTVVWNTDEPADSQIVYSEDFSFNQSTTLDGNLVFPHSHTFTGLQPNTPYNFRVRSRNAAGLLATSLNQQATTARDQTAPTITMLAPIVGETTATITWTTNEPADAQVFYGPTTAYGSQSDLMDTSPRTTNHSVTLTGLTPGQQIHYQVRSRDADGNSRESLNNTVTPVDTTNPVISSGPTVTAVTATTATITWTTNEDTDSRVRLGLSPSLEMPEQSNATLAKVHTFTVTGIGAVGQMRTYHARVRSFDAGGNKVDSDPFTFTTDGVAPVLSSVSPPSVTAASVTYTWTSNEPATSRIECESPQTGLLSTQSLVLTSSHNLTLSGLRAGTAYTCRVLSMDKAQNIGTANAAPATTPALSMSAVNASPGSTAATFTWTSNAPAIGTVDYGTTIGYGSTITGVSSTSHTLSTTAPLTPATPYFFRARSTDAWGQFVEQTGTFTTSP